MAHTPHASAAVKPGTDRFLDPASGSSDDAQRLLRADGLNAIEQSEREAALDENRSEEAEIFERAASRLRPAWSGPDQMLELGLANALPHPAAPEPEPKLQPVASVAALPRHPFEPVVLAPTSFPALQLPADEATQSSGERTDRFAALAWQTKLASLKERAVALLQQRRIALIAAAVACVVLGGLWAALSGDEPAKPAPAVVAPTAVAPPAVAPPAVAPAVVAPAAPVAPVVAAPVVKPVAKPVLKPAPAVAARKPAPVGKPGAKQPLKANKLGAKKPLAKAPAKPPQKRPAR